MPRCRSRVAALALLTLCSCIASRASVGVSAAERERIASAQFPLLVASLALSSGDPERSLPASEELREIVAVGQLLRATGYFREIDFPKQLHSPPDVLISVEEDSLAEGGIVFGGGVVSAWTLALVPVVRRRERSLAIEILSLDGEESLAVEVEYRLTEIFGWIALPLIPFPGWAWGTRGDGDVVTDRLRIALLDAEPEIERLRASAEAR